MKRNNPPTRMKRKAEKLNHGEREPHAVLDAFSEIWDSIREPLLILDSDLKAVKANRSFYQTFNVTPDETEGYSIYDLGNGQWNIPRLRELLEDILPQNTLFHDFEVEHTFAAIGRKIVHLKAMDPIVWTA